MVLYDLTDAPVCERYGSSRFQPDTMTVTYEDGKLRRVHLSGPMVTNRGLAPKARLAHTLYIIGKSEPGYEWVQQFTDSLVEGTGL